MIGQTVFAAEMPWQAYQARVKDVVKAFARHGVRHVCIVNGHFDNS